MRSASGEVLCSLQVPQFGAGAASPPNLPATITLPAGEGPERVRYFTADASDGGRRYRVRASAEQRSDAILVIATSLADVDATLRRLLLIEVLVTEAVETARTVEPDRPIEADVEPSGRRHNLLANVRAHTPAGAPVRIRLGREDGRPSSKWRTRSRSHTGRPGARLRAVLPRRLSRARARAAASGSGSRSSPQ